jgi:hypothetical protein
MSEPETVALAREILRLLIARTDGPGSAGLVLAIVVGTLYKGAQLAGTMPEDADQFWKHFREFAELLGVEPNAWLANIGKA